MLMMKLSSAAMLLILNVFSCESARITLHASSGSRNLDNCCNRAGFDVANANFSGTPDMGCWQHASHAMAMNPPCPEAWFAQGAAGAECCVGHFDCCTHVGLEVSMANFSGTPQTACWEHANNALAMNPGCPAAWYAPGAPGHECCIAR